MLTPTQIAKHSLDLLCKGPEYSEQATNYDRISPILKNIYNIYEYSDVLPIEKYQDEILGYIRGLLIDTLSTIDKITEGVK